MTLMGAPELTIFAVRESLAGNVKHMGRELYGFSFWIDPETPCEIHLDVGGSHAMQLVPDPLARILGDCATALRAAGYQAHVSGGMVVVRAAGVLAP